MSTPATAEDISRLEMKIEELRALITPMLALAVRQKSRTAQAHSAGVSVRTLQRREKRLSAKLRLNGIS